MKSVYITAHGGPEVLQIQERPDPTPGSGQVRVRVKAVGINFADILMRMGMYPGAPALPFVPGYEAAGVVDAAGDGAGHLREGDRVVVPTNFGGYTDTLIADAAQVFRLPDGKSLEAGAALAVNYMTAYLALVDQGNIQKGRKVLIHSVGGGVGIAATQICRIFDAEIFGTASSSKHDFLRKQGVHHCIDYRTENFEKEVMKLTSGGGVDIALDPVGGSSFSRSYRCLTKSGKLIIYGFSAASTGHKRKLLNTAWQWLRSPSFSPFDLMMNNRGVIGLHLGRMTEKKELYASAMTQLVQWWEQGKIEPVVGTTFPLELAGKAHEYIQSRQNIGKVVLTIQ